MNILTTAIPLKTPFWYISMLSSSSISCGPIMVFAKPKTAWLCDDRRRLKTFWSTISTPAGALTSLSTRLNWTVADAHKGPRMENRSR